MKSLVSSLISISLLFSSLPTYSQVKGRCFDIPEEAPSTNTVVRKFPNFNVQIEVAVNSNAVLLDTGEILIVDRGTYKYLQCLQNNPRALGRDITGYLISNGRKGAPNKSLKIIGPPEQTKFIVYTPNYSYLALRLLYSDQATDISIFGQYQGEEKETLRLLNELSNSVDLIVK